MSIHTLCHIITRFFEETLAPQNNFCHVCGQNLYLEGCYLCSDCLVQLEKQRLPYHDQLSHIPPFENCISAFSYDGPARSLVINLKFNSDFSSAEPLYYGMILALQERHLDQQIDMIIPVPLHEKRYRERGFNQSMKLGSPIAEFLKKPISSNALKRIRYTGTQVKRTGAERRVAMKNAFYAEKDEVYGKRILLVDDVFTTGSTGAACAEALLEAGAKSVWMVTACRA